MEESSRRHESFHFEFSGNLEDFRAFCAILRGEDDPQTLERALAHLGRSVQKVEHITTEPSTPSK